MSYTVFGSTRSGAKIGIQGPRGIPVAKGKKGDNGDRGDKGDKGDTGLNGVNGRKGDKGEKGEQGVKGEKGEPGEKGKTRERGEKGDKGEKGEMGIKGERGLRGDRGDVGPQGISVSDIAFSQSNKSFTLIFKKSDGTSAHVGPIDISFSDNEIVEAPVSITDLEVIPGRYQYSIKITKSDGTMKLYDILLSDPNEAANRRRKPP